MNIADVGNAIGSIGGVASAASSFAQALGGGGDWWSALRTASFRGVPFAVRSETGAFGRRIAVHEYPNKETPPWPEDMGASTNHIRITGFLVDGDLVYGGGSSIAQRDRLRKACETAGPGDLVHPTLGSQRVSCMGIEFGTQHDQGRVIEFRVAFIIAGDRLYPKAQQSSANAVLDAASKLEAPTLAGLVEDLASAVVSGAAMTQAAVSTTVGWYQTVNGLIHDVKRFWNSISTLSGNFGRLFGGGNSGFAASNKKSSSTATISSLISADTANRAAIATAGTALSAAAANVGSDPATFATAAQAVVAALAASAASPADAIRLLSSLTSFGPVPVVGASQTSIAQATTQRACADLFRRATIAQLAISTTDYQPSSADDAVAVRNSITALLDTEITTAADQGEDDAYAALRTLRQTVVADLDSRGAGLPAVATFSFGATLPALTLANRLYRDATREDELVAQANPIHPAFVSTTFKALSS